MNEQPVLDYILPILQFAVIRALSSKIKDDTSKRSIIIAGNDENIQWVNAVTAIGEDYIGALLIPELNKLNDINVNQGLDLKDIIQCVSKSQVFDNLETGNIASWFYRMFIALPNFNQTQMPDIFMDNISRPNGFWKDSNSIPPCIDQQKLTIEIWNRIENASSPS